MKLIIAGSRDFKDYKLLIKNIIQFEREVGEFTEIVCGEARGADALGRRLAEDSDMPIASFPANWDELGKKAGYVRNAEMAKYADALIVFWDGESKGTKHMINTGYKYDLKVKVICY